mgnify:CR=1 FL=1
MLLIALALFGCSEDEPNLLDDTDADPVVGTATRPIVEAVDSAELRDTGAPTTDTEVTDTSPGEATGDTGPPFIDTGVHVLEGRTFRFNPNVLSVVAGGVGITLFETNFLVQVLDVSPTLGTADLRVASFNPNTGGQAPCSPTADVSTDFSADPTLTFGPLDGATGLFGKVAPVEQATGAIQFNSGYDRITAANMTALWDIDAFATYYYGAGYGGAGLCGLLGAYGGGCTTCPASGSTTCLPITATGAEARWESGLVLTVRTQADIQADPSCP